jgi:hypothetical protein
MDDPFDVLDAALRSRYLAPADLPSVSFWHRLPTELRSVFSDALARGASLKTIVPLVWQVRARLLGKPAADYERTQFTVELRLGLLHLIYCEGRIGADELLSSASRVADSYIWSESDREDCCAAARPFQRLRSELATEGQAGAAMDRIAVLFAPYTAIAKECIERWGLVVPDRT